jgi:hypothetical protein
MFYRTEAKLQGWRALAIFEDGSQCLIYLGRSTTQVRAGYAAAFLEVLDEEERARVRSISLQCWHGAPDEGRWIPKATLAIPLREPVAAATSPGDSNPRILPLRRPSAATGKAGAPPRPEKASKFIAPTG